MFLGKTDAGNEETDLRFTTKKIVVLGEYLKQLTDCGRFKRKINKPRRGSTSRSQPYLPLFFK